MDHEGPDPLTRLRAAAAAVADLDAPDEAPAHDPANDPGRDPAPDAAHGTATGFDATAHADRFSELHDALVSVLADVDRG
ncbi:hypothetical protein [Actinomycetospora sp. TBRC 11914]|uniref:hypothetical protein n=1 Tax=Actinomycetospora sp. TBRC 11914 TaxID=2729387 RepID=UPI00145F072B|nr:hypothetical protein [Actinomycetospora sp. TBRC 11914]NMO89310.1 hypothetical protein [Actinomycetospora sp. TBRC 11914]